MENQNNINKMVIFDDSRQAVHYLVNVIWDNLTPEQRKFLRNTKREFNRNSISLEKMETVIQNFGKIDKKITLSI